MARMLKGNEDYYSDKEKHMSQPGTGAAELHGFTLDDHIAKKSPSAEVLATVCKSFVYVFGGEVARCAHDHGWYADPNTGAPIERNMGEMLMLMTSELAEGLEAYRDGEPVLWYDYGLNNKKLTGDNHKDFSPELPAHEVVIGDTGHDEVVLGKPCGLASELADTIIRILDTCVTLDIPLAEALARKHAYNLTRPYRHGGKLA